jgi:hypothetical protein
MAEIWWVERLRRMVLQKKELVSDSLNQGKKGTPDTRALSLPSQLVHRDKAMKADTFSSI